MYTLLKLQVGAFCTGIFNRVKQLKAIEGLMGVSGKEASGSVINYFIEVLRENEHFLNNKARDIYEEVVWLIEDSIEYIRLALKEQSEETVIDPMRFFLYHILMPQSYAIFADLLMGNLPACFMELRLMLESMAVSYLANLHPNKEAFFEGKMELLFERKRIAELLEEFGEKIELGREPVALWGKLSNEWVHTKGIVTRIIHKIAQEEDIPPWALAIPMIYKEKDLDALKELGRIVAKFREMLKRTMDKCGLFS